MTMKKLTVVLGIVSMIAVSGFSQMGPGKGDGKGRKGGMQKAHMMKGQKGKMQGFHRFAMLAGADTIMEKYRIKIKRVQLDAKESTIELRSEMKKLHMETVSLAKEYDKNPGTVGPKLAATIKKQRNVTKKLKAINMTTRKKVQDIREEMMTEVEKKVDAWVNTLGRDKDEMKKLVDMINSKKGMNCPKGMGGKGGKGMGKGNRR